MRIRIWASPALHRLDPGATAERAVRRIIEQGLGVTEWVDNRLGVTRCGVLFAWTRDWPKSDPRPPLPDCAGCWS